MLSQVTDRTINELCELPIDESINENTESHTVRLSKEMDDANKTF